MTEPRADAYDLQRFEHAQARRETYTRAVSELRAGRKRSDWMWFVFPQLVGLGHSPQSELYAISSLAEAHEYLAHPVLGPRLTECSRILMDLSGSDPRWIFGDVDAMKLRSSMTLFEVASPDTRVFRAVLNRYFDGEADDRTEWLLRHPSD